MSDTLGSLRAEILLWLRGDLATSDDQPLVNSAINDALEDIWMSMMRVQLAKFFGSDTPSSFVLAQGQQRVQLVLIGDPTLAPTLGQIGGGVLGARVYNVSYTFVTESGAETNPSPIATLAVNLNSLLTVAAPAEPAGGAFGWNLYVGVQNQALQNQQPLPFGITYNEPVTGYQDYPTFQQTPPTSNQTADNISYITHLEITHSDSTMQTWDQWDISSSVMRKLAATFPSASEYQGYAWDLINGRTLEFRPPAGLTFIPRFFYVAKPRRLRYDQAEIPYANIAGLHEFLVRKSISDLKLSIEEYIASEAWDGKAEKSRGNILLALTQESWNKNTKVTPHLY